MQNSDHHRLNQQNKIAGGFWGLLVGDALGVPYEFHQASEIPPFEHIEMTPPENFERAHESILPGTWSDDGAQALCLLASLLHCNRLDLADFANRLTDWHDLGYMAVDQRVYDVGITTSHAIQKLRLGTPPHLAGPTDAHSNGNGALMRVLPLALWHQGSDKALVQDARLQSCVTHGHLRSQLCCALYALVARYILQNENAPWAKAVKTIRLLHHNDSEATEELESHIRPDDPIPPEGSGYVVDSLRAANTALQSPDYEHAVKNAIALGKDTDTTACIAGGLIGLRDGVQGIPGRWLTRLRGRELALKPLNQLLTLRSTP